MKRMTPEEAAEWRRKSVERYRAKRQKSPTRTTKPVTPQRSRKQAEDAEYRVNREKRLVQARGRCEWVGGNSTPGLLSFLMGQCHRPATQTHHVRRRSNHLDHSVENLRALCLEHHQYIHLNVGLAKEMGWIRAEWPQIGELPMER